MLIDSLGRDILLFPEPGLFHFEPWEYSLHLLKKKNKPTSIYVSPRSASFAIKKKATTVNIGGSYPNKERLHHAVGFPALRMAAVPVNGSLNDSHNVVTELQLGGRNCTDAHMTLADLRLFELEYTDHCHSD